MTSHAMAGRAAAVDEDVELCGADGVERGQSSGDEAGDGDTARHGRQSRHQLLPRSQEDARPAGLVGDQLADGGGGGRLSEVVVGAAEAEQVVLRQVHASGGEVLADVLQVFDDLQPAANVVGEASAVGVCHPEDGEHGTTDWVGRQPAVVEQLVERGVAVLALVAAVGLDEVPKRVEVEAVAPDCRRQGVDGGVRSLAARCEVEVVFQPVEGGEPVAVVAVTDVVGEAGEAVHREQVDSQRAGQHPEGDREVFRLRLEAHGIEAWQARRQLCT